MEFTNSFAVEVPLPRVWTLLLDAQQVAPCVPGAQLTESVDALHHRGTVKIKLGAVQMTYRGELEMQPDEATRTIVLKAKGSESRGAGAVTGTFTTTLAPTGAGGTLVDIHTRVDVTGRVAQFGRGIMQDVANRMLKDFASCLEAKVGEAAAAERPGPPASERDTDLPAASPETAGIRPASAPSPDVSTAPAASAIGNGSSTPAEPRMEPVRTSPSARATEIRVGKLLLDITRDRIASGLRILARIIEP